MLSFDIRRLLSNPWIYESFVKIVGHEQGRRRYVDEVLQPHPGDRVLDIGCGPAQLLDYFPLVDYHGFDMNSQYIESARRRFGDRGNFYCRRVTNDAVADLGLFDLVTATGILHHLSNDEATAMFDLAYRALKPGGRFVSCDGCYVPHQNLITRLILKADRGAYVRDERAYVQFARTSFTQVSAQIRNDLSRIPYTYVVLECVR